MPVERARACWCTSPRARTRPRRRTPISTPSCPRRWSRRRRHGSTAATVSSERSERRASTVRCTYAPLPSRPSSTGRWRTSWGCSPSATRSLPGCVVAHFGACAAAPAAPCASSGCGDSCRSGAVRILGLRVPGDRMRRTAAYASCNAPGQGGRAMRLDEQQESGNVEDRRGMSPGMLRGGGLGCGGLLIVLAISYFTGIDPRQLLQTVEQTAPPASSTQTAPTGKPADTLGKFAAQVLGSTEQVWGQVFSSNNRRYAPPTMVLFSGAVQSACGQATAEVGPFYCPNDSKLYLDTSFFSELDRLGGSGDSAAAYVIA